MNERCEEGTASSWNMSNPGELTLFFLVKVYSIHFCTVFIPSEKHSLVRQDTMVPGFLMSQRDNFSLTWLSTDRKLLFRRSMNGGDSTDHDDLYLRTLKVVTRSCSRLLYITWFTFHVIAVTAPRSHESFFTECKEHLVFDCCFFLVLLSGWSEV